jgi:hypothetical protein
MKTYSGSCHCGAVRFTAATDLETVIECDCSHCHRKGFVLVFVPPEAFNLLSGEDSLTEYLFNSKTIRHRFCKVCGVQPFAEGLTSRHIAINLRCLEDLDFDSLSPTKYNGKDL